MQQNHEKIDVNIWYEQGFTVNLYTHLHMHNTGSSNQIK